MKFKKYVSIILALLLSYNLCVPAIASNRDYDYASDDTEIQNQMLRILASVEHEKDYYGLENVDFSSVEIGNEIQTYRVENKDLVRADIRLIPVLLSGKLVSLFSVAKHQNGEIYVQLSNDLVPLITAYTDVDPYAIIYDNIGVHIYTRNTLNLLGLAEMTVDADNEVLALADDNSNSVSSLTDDELLSIEVTPIVTNVTLDANEFAANLVSTYASTSKYLYVQTIKQPVGSNSCWAIAVTAIANYIYNASYTYDGYPL